MLDAKKLGISGGIICGGLMFLLTLIALFTGYGEQFLSMHAHMGYSVSLIGSLVGLVYGFIKGFIFFFLLAWIYNRLDI